MAELHTGLRDAVVQDARRGAFRRRVRRAALSMLGCLGVSLVALGLLAFGGAYVVARSGLVEVPVLSARITHERAPRRIVVPITVSLEALLSHAAGSMRDGVMAVQVDERALTGLLRAALHGNSGVPAGMAESTQITVDGDLELFARAALVGDTQTTILVRGVPEVSEGRLQLAVREAVVGTIRIPPALAQRVLNNLLARQDLPIAIEGIEVGERALTVRVRRP